jgi:hypothetical protein
MRANMMELKQEKFDHPEKAVQYLLAGLSRDFPDAILEVIQVVRNRPRKARCAVAQAASVLSKACQKFPMASVEYHPGNPYGFVAEIRCHGEIRSGNTSFSRHTSDRPRVLIMVTQVGDRDILVGSHKVPAAE